MKKIISLVTITISDQLRSARISTTKSKKPVLISTLNTRNLKKQGNLEELNSNLRKYNISILGIQEHRFIHTDEPISYQTIEGNYLITTSAWKNAQNEATSGIGILLSPKSKMSLGEVKKISHRVMTATFQGKPATTIIVAYSPTKRTDNETKSRNYKTI